jgi:uncharacterized phage protein (TIGR02220 family)
MSGNIMEVSVFLKLDCAIVFKSIWAEDSDTCKVWITMLAMADSDGLLSAAVTGISSVSKVSIENTQKAIDIFLSPDKLSTNPDHEGRRIERVNEGYKILNYEVYRQKDHTAAARMRKHRDLLRVTGVTLQPVYVSDSVLILNYLNLKTGRKYRNTKEILARLAAGHKVDDFKKIIDTKAVDPFFMENPQHLNPVTLFRKSHFDTYLNQRPEDFRANGKIKQPADAWEKDHHYDDYMSVENNGLDEIEKMIAVYMERGDKLNAASLKLLTEWQAQVIEAKGIK